MGVERRQGKHDSSSLSPFVFSGDFRAPGRKFPLVFSFNQLLKCSHQAEKGTEKYSNVSLCQYYPTLAPFHAEREGSLLLKSNSGAFVALENEGGWRLFYCSLGWRGEGEGPNNYISSPQESP